MERKTITEKYEKSTVEGNVLNVKISKLQNEEVPFCEDTESLVCLVAMEDGIKTFVGGKFSPKAALEFAKCIDSVKGELLKVAIKMIAEEINEEEKKDEN